tara:strand:- start:610 stop:2172 length:1563 start_codon:yes stop_codon:yes gene_type:complete
MSLKTISIPAAALMLSIAASAQTYYVDPANGFDFPGFGQLNLPFKSITFAASQAVGGSTPLTINLFPGDYSAASGEVFPILLFEEVTVQALQACSVNIRHRSNAGAPATPAMQLTMSASGTAAYFADLRFVGNQQGLVVEVLDGDHDITMDRVETEILASASANSGIGRHVIANGVTGQAFINYAEFGCQSRDGSIGSWFETGGDGFFFGFVANHYTGGINALQSSEGFRLETDGFGEMELSFGNCIFQKHLRGIETRRLSAAMYLLTEHCAFHNNGLVTFVQQQGGPGMQVISGGAIDEVVGQVDTMAVINSAFWANAVDLPDYSTGTYSDSDNVIQDPALIGSNGNVGGDPMWVAPGQADFHILPGSPCRNAVYASLDFDYDSDDRTVACASMGDIGPDESFDADHYIRGGNLVPINSTATIGVYGDGGSVAVVVTGQPTGLVCGVPVDIATVTNLLAPFFMPGSPGAREFTTATLAVPNTATLIGQSLPVAAAFVNNPAGIPTLQVSPNLRTVLFCK